MEKFCPVGILTTPIIFTKLPTEPIFTVLGAACVPMLIIPAYNPNVPKSANAELLFVIVIPASLFAEVTSFALKSIVFVVKEVVVGFNDNICFAAMADEPYKNLCSLAADSTL